MSSIDFKRSVQIVQTTVGTTASLIKSAGSVLNGAIALSSKAMNVYKTVGRSGTNVTTTLRSVVAVNQDAIAVQQQVLTLGQAQGLSTPETIQVAALTTANLYVADRSQIIQQAMKTLASNPTPAALASFTRQLESEHQPLVTQSLSLACQQASLKVGFASIQTSTAADGTLRVIATDDRGRTLVTEIGTAIDRETTIATEVIGMSDSSCGQILDEFHQALAEAGVQSSPPERKSTGGVCELEAAKEFIRRQPVKSKAVPTDRAKSSTPRRQVTKPQQNQQF
jgi:hypothetical protein